MSFSPKPALIAACLALAAGGGGAALLATTAGASTVTTTSTSTSTGTGTATVSVTGPAGKTHTRTLAVSCTTAKGRYVVRSVTKHGRRSLRLRLAVRDYSGAGSYTGTAMITRRSANGFSRHHFKVPVTLTSTGGSVSVTKTLSGKRNPANAGKTISATAHWTCSV